MRKYLADAPFERRVWKTAVNGRYDPLCSQLSKGQDEPVEDSPHSLRDPATEETRSDEAWEILKPALAKLRPEERLVITLLNLQEKSIREISRLTGWSEAKVKVRAFRARRELQRILEDIFGN